jgi:inner membrane protein involved in colicin E2 resistance
VHPVLRILGIVFVFLLATAAWVVLGGVTSSRSGEQRAALDGRVADLWGSAQTQNAPAFALQWYEPVQHTEQVTDARGYTSTVLKTENVLQTLPVDASQSRVNADLKLDERRKGLTWFPLYDVTFDGAWAYVHSGPDRTLVFTFAFPDAQGVYDDFHLRVDGVDRAHDLRPANGSVTVEVPVHDGQKVAFEAGYRSRGQSEWRYQPTPGGGQVEDFALAMTTDFRAIDFPTMTMSPSTRTPTAEGWRLDWTFSNLVTGYGIGMVMPTHIQPGELASDMSFSAALPLGLFFLWIYVLGLLRGTQIHPINYLFVAAAFFAFNLIFSYTADHLPVEGAFALSSAVSLFLVASYLRLVVGARFALVEAGLAQLLYQIGFSLAHFFDGYTGLTITILGTGTLFALMQLTGRINWSEALSSRAKAAA